MADMDYSDTIEHSNDRFAAVCETDDAREGIAAFLEGAPLDTDEWPDE